MKYKNTRTGVVIDSPCVISGGDWVSLEDLGKLKDVSTTKKGNITKKSEPATRKTNFDDVDLDSMKVDELKAFAKKQGIKFDAKLKKNDLIEVIAEVIY